MASKEDLIKILRFKVELRMVSLGSIQKHC